MIYKDKLGRFLGEEEISKLSPLEITEREIHLIEGGLRFLEEEYYEREV